MITNIKLVDFILNEKSKNILNRYIMQLIYNGRIYYSSGLTKYYLKDFFNSFS